MQSEKTKTGPVVQQAINTQFYVVTKAEKKKKKSEGFELDALFLPDITIIC